MSRSRSFIGSLVMAVWVSAGCSAAVAGAPAAGGSAAGSAGSAGQLPGGPVPSAPEPTPVPSRPAQRGGAPAAVAPDGLLQVDRIDVQVLGSLPAQVQVRVQGMLLDGCTSLGKVSQRRQNGAVTVTIP